MGRLGFTVGSYCRERQFSYIKTSTLDANASGKRFEVAKMCIRYIYIENRIRNQWINDKICTISVKFTAVALL